jgi:signal peptidase II
MTTDHDREDDRPAEPADGRVAAGDRGTSASGDPAPEHGARWPLLLGVAAVALALDQTSKAWAVDALGDGHIIDVVGSLRLRLTMNYGSAFSLADGRGPLISLLALVVVAVLLRTGRHATCPTMAVALGLVVGGAFGNLIDRAFRAGDGFLGGGVVDFVDLQWWPVFNVADSAIVVGAILLFIAQWREPDPDAAPDAAPGSDPPSAGTR